MSDIKKIFICGITGNQGGAVARHALKNDWKVTGLSRSANSEKANYWKDMSANIVEGMLENPSAYESELKDADSIFLVQPLQKKEGEIKQAKNFLDVVKTLPVKHLVYASVLGADLNTGVPHFDSKNEIESYIRASGINHTVLRPASFYENYLFPRVADGIKKGKFVSPLVKSCRQQMIGVDDIGKIACKVISDPEKYSGKTISIATDEYQISEVPDLFSGVMGSTVKYQKLPGFITRLAMGRDLHKMFRYMNKHDFRVVDNIPDVRDEFGIQGNFRDWVKRHFT